MTLNTGAQSGNISDLPEVNKQMPTAVAFEIADRVTLQVGIESLVAKGEADR